MKPLFCFLAGLFLLFSVAACTPNISPDSYAVGSVGQANRAVRGVIISVRQVDISGSRSGVGGTAGAAGGAVAGSAIGGGTRANILGAIGGAVIGGIAASVIEEGSTRQKGMEYVIETQNGALITMVQGIDPPLSVGRKVIVLYGTRSRIIPDQSDKSGQQRSFIRINRKNSDGDYFLMITKRNSLSFFTIDPLDYRKKECKDMVLVRLRPEITITKKRT